MDELAKLIAASITAFLGGATISGLITYKVTSNKMSKKVKTTVTQTGNTAGRDIIGSSDSQHLK